MLRHGKWLKVGRPMGKRHKVAVRRPAALVVRALGPAEPVGRMVHGGQSYQCALGRSGRCVRKREGDGATPIGTWRLEQVLYRADRVRRPWTALPVRALHQDDGWCDAPGDRNYNRSVRHPYPASAERMWREDGLYDIVVVLSHNRRPRVQGGGSAIFMHVAREGFAATEGCIALERQQLARLLARLERGARVVVAR